MEPPLCTPNRHVLKYAERVARGIAGLLLTTVEQGADRLGIPRRNKGNANAYMETGAYERDVRQIVDAIRGPILARAFALSKSTKGNTAPVVIFDIDDTLLSTCWGRRRRVCPGGWLQPIEPVVDLHRQLRAAGVRTVLLTGRWTLQREQTLANLWRVGVAGWDHALFRDPRDASAYLLARDYKACQRARLAAAGYAIVAVIGDQHSDMAHDGPGGIIDVLLPNPFYTVR
jgi:hypothetical protein